MKNLKFKVISLAYDILCNRNHGVEVTDNSIYHFKFTPNISMTTIVTLENTNGKPLKLKVFQDDILLEEHDYFGDDTYQNDLDTYNTNNNKPLENIKPVMSIIHVVDLGTTGVLDFKVYCPFMESGFYLDFNCK